MGRRRESHWFRWPHQVCIRDGMRNSQNLVRRVFQFGRSAAVSLVTPGRPRTAPVGTNWRAGCEKSQHSGRQHGSANLTTGSSPGRATNNADPPVRGGRMRPTASSCSVSRSAACSRPRWRARKRCAASSCSERWPHAHRRIPAARSASSRNSMRSMSGGVGGNRYRSPHAAWAR